MSFLSQENHAPVQLGALTFANFGVNDFVQIATIFLSVGYFVIYLIDKRKEWGKERTCCNGKETESREEPQEKRRHG